MGLPTHSFTSDRNCGDSSERTFREKRRLPHIKNLLLARFQLTPLALRDRFESHQRRPGAMWADLVFELRSYLDNWLAGMKVGDFAALKELLVTEQIKKRAPSELVDHFLDSWDGFKEAKSLAEKLDHFEAIRRVHKKTGPTKTWECRIIDKQPLERKNKSAHFSDKGKNIGPLNRDPYKHEVSHGSSQIRRECPRAGENQFEKRKPIICYYCNETGHIKPVCPRLRKNNFETVANLTLNTGNYDPFKKFKMNMEINGIDRVCLRDSGDVEEFVKTCDSCQRVGKPRDKAKAPLKLVPIISEVFSKINIDAVGPLPVSTKQNRYLITSICVASKYPEAIPVESITSPNVIDALLSIFSRIGFPREIQSDLGTSFTSELTTTFFNKFGIKVTRSSVSHPQSNAVERVHRTIKRIIKALCVESGEDWEGVLPLALFSLRTVAHESTGFSPTELVMGKNLRTPQTLVYEEWMEEGNTSQLVVEYILQLNNRLKRCQDIAITRMKECQLKRKTWYDRDVVERKFVEGDLVMVLVTSKQNKLEVNWIGPGKVLSRISDTNYVIDLPGRRDRSTIYHVNLLKPYYRRPELIDELKQVITKNKDVFSPDPGTTHLMRMDIELISDKPIKTKPYRMSPRQINILRKEIKLESPNKDPRPCVDYHRLNEITRAEFFPLPNMEEIVEKLSAAPYVAVMDLSKGYFQIPLTPRAQRYAAFVTPFGTYIPKKMMFGTIASPLTDALKGKIKKEKITWDEKCGKAFEELKAKLVSQPIMFAPDFATDFILQTDASEVGAGVVLSQRIEGEEHPIVFLSKKFSKAEQNYSTVERELAAIIFGLKRLKHYLDGQKFIIETDHNPLRYLNKMGSTNPRLQRWALSLQPFNFEIKHKPGRLHGNADGLSRLE
ncbi:retrovirus-related Pol polyprotein from transposon 297 [Trichonephila clavipes]|nr:retrovirus-related Pol polyprotein from transposon 297 [Trichonephila clavipes]